MDISFFLERIAVLLTNPKLYSFLCKHRCNVILSPHDGGRDFEHYRKELHHFSTYLSFAEFYLVFN